MTYRFYSDEVTSSAGGVSLLQTARGDVITFTRSARYIAGGTNAHVVLMKFDSSVVIDGSLYSGNGATILTQGAKTATSVRVGASGLVSSADGAALANGGASMRVTNAGEIAGKIGVSSSAGALSVINDGVIDGRTAGVSADAGSLWIANTSAISGEDWGVRVTGGSGGQFVTNSGVLSAITNAAVAIAAAGDIGIVNSGTITGRTGVSFAADAADAGDRSFVNHGVVSASFAAFEGSLAADRVDNDGDMFGRVLLGGGDDAFRTTRAVAGRVDGGAGNDVLEGADGGRDTLAGSDGDDQLFGYGGNDVLMPGAGADLVDGGDGRDLLSYRDATAGVTVGLGGAVPPGGLHPTLVSIEAVEGSDFADVIWGTENADRISGGLGDDRLDGKSGDDVLIGGGGNDTYVVDAGTGGGSASGDRVIEDADGGFDTVDSFVGAYVLPDNVERLLIHGGVGYGNAGDNTIIGGASGGEQFFGGGGNDRFTGGGGADLFILEHDSRTTITDLSSDDYLVLIRQDGFQALPAGTTLPDSAFVLGTAAGDEDDRIIYDPATHRIFYDPDGIGSAAKELIGTLSNGVTPLASQFYIGEFA